MHRQITEMHIEVMNTPHAYFRELQTILGVDFCKKWLTYLQVLHGKPAGQQHVVELHDAVLDDGQLTGDAINLGLSAALEVFQLLRSSAIPGCSIMWRTMPPSFASVWPRSCCAHAILAHIRSDADAQQYTETSSGAKDAPARIMQTFCLLAGPASKSICFPYGAESQLQVCMHRHDVLQGAMGK